MTPKKKGKAKKTKKAPGKKARRLGVLVRRGSGIKRLADLHGGAICLKRGAAARDLDEALDELRIGVTFRYFDRRADALAAYRGGEYTGLAAYVPTLKALRKKLPKPGAHAIRRIPRARGTAASRLTVPVQIDSVKWQEKFQRTRCVYYRIEFEDGLILEPGSVGGEQKTLLATWGSWAVLVGPGRPLSATGLFSSPELIDEALAYIEETEGLFVDLGYIWLPNELLGLRDQKDSARRGDVYRLSMPLFSQCHRYAMDRLAEQEWLEFCRSHADAVQPSSEETAAFRQWRRNQVARSRERYYRTEFTIRRLPKGQRK